MLLNISICYVYAYKCWIVFLFFKDLVKKKKNMVSKNALKCIFSIHDDSSSFLF